MSAVYRPMSLSQKNLSNMLFFRPCHPKFIIFHAKIGILVEYLYISHTLFILYLERNHTLFGEKLYFICKFISGNTAPGIRREINA